METQQGRYNVINNENKNKNYPVHHSTIPVVQSTVYTPYMFCRIAHATINGQHKFTFMMVE